MAQDKPEYEVNDEFNSMAIKIVNKYPEKFAGIDVSRVCCVNITNKDRKDKDKDGNGERIWRLQAVKMPVAIHCPYGWYVTLYSHDWDDRGEKHKLLLVTEVLHGFPISEDNEGKVNPLDTKGYHAVFNTFGLDCHDDPGIPHILDETVSWKE